MSQSVKAVLYNDAGGVVTEQISAPAAGECGDVIQTADGKAGVVLGADGQSSGFASGDLITVARSGRFKVLKTTSMVLLAGGKAYWDRSAEKCHFRPQSGDFYLGRIWDDAASSDTEAIVDLNVEPQYQVELGKGKWNNGATDGLGVTLVAEGGTELKLAFDAVAEVAMAALYPVDTIPVADLGIIEGRCAIYDIGDDAALDINMGIANGTHATDADSITESVFLHLDGSSLDINVESDDGTTENAAADSTVDAVDDTYFEWWIDCRDIDNIKVYIDGVRVMDGTTGASKTIKLDEATGPMFPIVHLEKTSNDTTADVRVDFLRARSSDIAA